jgi:O-acetyl-ADP-ribose deacetylase (regulator of RNase III)
MQTITGDLIDQALNGDYDVIVQGCNCMCQMGKGIALTIKTVFPEAYTADCTTIKGDITKLGTITTATVSVKGKPLTIVNGYTQYNWKGDGVLADVEAIKQVMLTVKNLYQGLKIGIPLIGAGLAKGDWATIQPVIEDVMQGEDLTVVILPTVKQ